MNDSLEQRIFGDSADGFFSVDESWRLVYFNCRYADAAENRSTEFDGRVLWEAFPGIAGTALESVCRQVMEARVVQRLELHDSPRGRWYNTIVFPLQEGIGVYWLDITANKKSEETLAFQANLLSSVYDGIFATDENGVITYWNNVAEQLTGWPASLMVGRRAGDLFSEMTVKASWCRIMLGMHRSKYKNGEILVKRRDGTTFYAGFHARQIFDQQGRFRSVVTSFRDITNRRQSQNKIRLQNTILTTINQVYEKSFYCKTLEELGKTCLNIIQAATKSRAGFIGQIVGSQFREIAVCMPDWEKNTQERVEWFQRLCVSADQPYGRSLQTGETLMVSNPDDIDFAGLPEGHPAITSFLCTPCMHGGRVIGLAVMANRDGGYSETEKEIMEALAPTVMQVLMRKQTEDKLYESEKHALALVEQLQEAGRRKNEFISILSHELRNPLATISVGLQLNDLTEDKEKIENAKQIMNRQIRQLCSLVDDLLDLVRFDQNKIRLKKEPVLLNDLAAAAAEDLLPQFNEKGVRLCVDMTKDVIMLDADPVRITQLVGNLLYNAIKFTDKGGEARLSVYADGADAVIRVSDNGIGISPELLPMLFEPFVQAESLFDRSNGGLGLGLALVKNIAELHGGTARAESEGLGKGAGFEIRLPLPRQPADAGMPKERVNKGGALRVLLIDDNRDFAYILSTTLALLGHTTVTARCGRDGLKRVRELKPDVIFCDIGLPDMSGYDVACELRGDDALKDTCVFALTGYAAARDAERAREAGFDKLIAKPIVIEDLEKLLTGCRPF